MSFTPPHRLNYLIDLDPNAAKAEILKALRKAKMHRFDAASLLKCDEATLFRWIKRLDLSDEIRRLDRVARKEGWFHGKVGGRPFGS